MDRDLIPRRTEMIKYACKGVPLKDIIDDLHKKYQISREALYSDWGRRKKWMPQLAALQDSSLTSMLIYGLQQIIPNAWHEYVTGDNTAARIGALRLAKETYQDLIEILQSLGIEVKMPDQIRVIADWSNKPPESQLPQTTTSPTKADK